MPASALTDHSLQAQQAKPKKRSKKALREAGGAAAPAAAFKKASGPLPPPSESDESSEDEDEEPAPGPRIQGYAGGAFEALPAGDAAGWESVGGGKKKAAGTRLSGSGGFSSVASRGGRSSSKAGQAAAQGKKKAEHACERPGCGAIGSRGFKKCGRCHAVYYCTPACLASDWERHQLNCKLD
ncbi:hypothetical protein ABPG75_007761 [Micractinium tetrahymenae]